MKRKKIILDKCIFVGKLRGEIYGFKHSLKTLIFITIEEIKEKAKTIDLKEVDKQIVLSMYGRVHYPRKLSCITVGQISDVMRIWAINDMFKEYRIDKATLYSLLDIWNRWHLNNMRAGTRGQLALVRYYIQETGNSKFEDICQYLKSKGLLYDRGHKYGGAWLYEPLPQDIIDYLKSL